jgi:hypothetical protein
MFGNLDGLSHDFDLLQHGWENALRDRHRSLTVGTTGQIIDAYVSNFDCGKWRALMLGMTGLSTDLASAGWFGLARLDDVAGRTFG